MKTRAKFRCTSKTEDWAHHVAFMAVAGDSEENEKYFAATPSGDLKLGGLKPEVAALFEVGKEYYLDVTEAPAE